MKLENAPTTTMNKMAGTNAETRMFALLCQITATEVATMGPTGPRERSQTTRIRIILSISLLKAITAGDILSHALWGWECFGGFWGLFVYASAGPHSKLVAYLEPLDGSYSSSWVHC